jgi:hypothetical protein
MEKYDEKCVEKMIDLINRLSFCSPPLSPAWVSELSTLVETASRDRQAFCSKLNHQRIWGGAASLASEALKDNHGLPKAVWHMHVREFRDLMIELGELLRTQAHAYPDIQAWLLAFHNWNNADV